MLDTMFLDRQRHRLRRRMEQYPQEAQRDGIPEDLATIKIFIARSILPVALKRVEEGTYGSCIDCNKEIPRARLEIVPGAIRCVECQTLYEMGRR